MDIILLWFWTGVFAATVLWWLIMLMCVAFIGPAELRAMFGTLNQSHTDESTADSNHST